MKFQTYRKLHVPVTQIGGTVFDLFISFRVFKKDIWLQAVPIPAQSHSPSSLPRCNII